MEDCLFCKIARKEKDAEFVYEDERFAAFRDVNPKAPVHVLLVPKEHIGSLAEAGKEHRDLLGALLLTAHQVARSEGLTGYKLQFNVGRQGGQVIDHIHLHVLGNQDGQVPGTLA